MSVFQRIVELTKAATHEVLEKLESPSIMMNQYIRDMENEIAEVKSELARQEAAARSYKLQHAEMSRYIEQYEAKALEALAAGREAEAREALTAKLHYADKAKAYLELHEAAVTRKHELTYKLESANEELAALHKKRTELTARLQQAEAKARTSMPSFNSTAGFEGGTAARGFQRMEEKIAELEARLELSGKHAPYGNHGVYGTPSVPTSPVAPSDPAKDALVAEQLELLRKKLPQE